MMADLQLWVKKYINSKEAPRAMDNLDLSNAGTGVGNKVRPTFSLTHAEQSSGKRSTDQGRDDHKHLRFND